MKDIAKLAPPYVRAVKKYVCARDIYRQGGVMLDANESPYAQPLQAMAVPEEGLNRYPDPMQEELRAELAKYAGTAKGNVLVTNGSDEAILLVSRAFLQPGDNVVCVEPGYSMYATCANSLGAKAKTALLGKGFSLDSNAVLAKIDSRTKIIFIPSPNSPTGAEMDIAKIEKIAGKSNCIVFIDEAYIEFGGKSAIGMVGKYQNLVVSRTLSKAWGLAGIRIGYAIAQKPVMDLLGRIKLPYNVNSVSAGIALEAVSKNRAAMQKSVESSRRQRAILAKALVTMGFEVYPSCTNFILVKPAPWMDSAAGIVAGLAKKGIIVRDRSGMPMIENALRITVGTPEENGMLVQGMKGVLGIGYDSVIFDMDGVLVDVSKSYDTAIMESADEVLAKKSAGMEAGRVSMDEVRKVKALAQFNNDWDAAYAIIVSRIEGKEPAKMRVSPSGRKSGLYAMAKAVFQKKYAKLSRLEKPLAKKEDFARLAAAGTRMGICTGRPKAEALDAIAKFGWQEFFNPGNIVALEDCNEQKPSPKPVLEAVRRTGGKKPLYIGDCESDRQACSAAGIDCAILGEKAGKFAMASACQAVEIAARPDFATEDDINSGKPVFGMARAAKIERKTSETDIKASLAIDGTGKADIRTGIGFFDHMLAAVAKHGDFDISLKCKGDLDVDQHHTIEDAGIALGMAFEKALGSKKGIMRSGNYAFPMDEAMAIVSIDLGGRAYLNFDAKFSREFIGTMQSDLVKEFFAGFAQGAKCNLHVRMLYPGNDHHKCESIFKGFARALAQACEIRRQRLGSVPSTKGVI